MQNQFEQSLIEQLTRIGDALEKLQSQYGLNQTIIADETIEQQTKPSRKAKKKAEPVEPVEPEQSEPNFTHEDLKQTCLTAVRQNIENKAKLKALLAEYGATKAVDVPADKIKTVIHKIVTGEY